MLIRALCEYASYMEDKGDASAPFGYSDQKVSFEILLTTDGDVADIIDIREESQKMGKGGKLTTIYNPILCKLPERTQKSAVCSNIIEHRPLYIFGLNYYKGVFTATDKTSKAKKSHDAFCSSNIDFFENLKSDICKAYVSFMKKWNSADETGNDCLIRIGKDYSTSYFCFGLYGSPELMLHKDGEFIKKYEKYLAQKAEESDASDKESAVCSILGENLPIARIHDKITGLTSIGGSSMGCSLINMNETAYESYGKKQSMNSCVSEDAMKKYTKVLNSLLADRRHHKAIDDMMMVFFAMKNDDSAECERFSYSLFDDNKNTVLETDNSLESVHEQAAKGTAANIERLEVDENCDFYVFGITANNSRVSQKFFLRNKFGEIIKNIKQHQADLAVDESGEQIELWLLLKQLVSPKASKDAKVSSALSSAIFYSILNGTNYPYSLLTTVISRIKVDSDDEKKHFVKINQIRIGIIKACLNRKSRLYGKEEEITMALDTNNINQAYLCGRLFAVIEKAQQESVEGELNRTIKGTYFSSAASRPSVVMPRLCSLYQHYLKKRSCAIFYNKIVGEIMDKMNVEFPTTLSTDEQGKFIIGYFHQSQAFFDGTYKKAENSDN